MKTIISIKGMTCSACSSGLEKYLKKQKGINDAIVNLVMASASIEHDKNITLEDLARYVKEAGFESLGIFDEHHEEKEHQKAKKYFIIFGILSVFLLYITMAHMIGLPNIPFLDMHKYPYNYSICLLILTIPYLFYGYGIIKSGYKNLIHRTPNMDTLVSIGVISSFIYSLFNTYMIFKGNTSYVNHLYYESSAIVIFFIKLGRYIDSKSKNKTKEAIKKLVEITPSKALLKTKDGSEEITLDEIKKGDILIAKPGMKIAVDGTITSGTTHVDESFITGESLPVKKNPKSKVIAGSINFDGYIEYKAEKIGRDSTISEIVKLVIEATNTKAPIAKLADRVSSYFVPCIMIISVLSFIGNFIITKDINTSINSFVTVLVVACPCALGLATPLAIVVSEGVCANNGILVKTSEALENAHKVDTIVFDKTGTLTYGNLKISKIYNYSDKKDFMSIVCSIESKSTHPISRAFNEYQKEKKLSTISIDTIEDLPGFGIKAHLSKDEYLLGNQKILKELKLSPSKDEETLKESGNSIVYVIKNKKVIGLIGVSDIIKKEAKETIEKLNNLNIKVIMLTGDNEKTAQIIANQLNIKHIIANVLPKEKTNVIKELNNHGHKVIMVGDGINDAPSLAGADIGISVSGGTDIANDSANIILLNGNLKKIITLLTISKKTIQNIKQNLFWAFFYNICMIPIAIGFLKPWHITLNPMFAGLAMTLSSLTVIINALRLKRIKLESR